MTNSVGLLAFNFLCALISAKWALDLNSPIWKQILWGVLALLFGPLIPFILYIRMIRKLRLAARYGLLPISANKDCTPNSHLLLPVTTKAVAKTLWSLDEKVQLILESLRNNHPITQFCQDHTISEIEYYEWMNTFLTGGRAALNSFEQGLPAYGRACPGSSPPGVAGP